MVVGTSNKSWCWCCVVLWCWCCCRRTVIHFFKWAGEVCNSSAKRDFIYCARGLKPSPVCYLFPLLLDWLITSFRKTSSWEQIALFGVLFGSDFNLICCILGFFKIVVLPVVLTKEMLCVCRLHSQQWAQLEAVKWWSAILWSIWESDLCMTHFHTDLCKEYQLVI